MPTEYDTSDIQVLEYPENIQRRPGMYVGGTGLAALHHLAHELVDNAVDEAMAGICDCIVVTLHKDGSVTVEDNGRGIPVEIMPDKNQSALTLALTELHTGGKFEGSRGGYLSGSGGLHGIGVKATNGYSEWLEVRVKRDGVIYRQRFENGGDAVTEVEALHPRTEKTIGAGGGGAATPHHAGVGGRGATRHRHRRQAGSQPEDRHRHSRQFPAPSRVVLPGDGLATAATERALGRSPAGHSLPADGRPQPQDDD